MCTARIYLLIILGISTLRLQGQYYEPDSLPAMQRNSLGIILNPAVGVMLNNPIPFQRYGLHYKRWITEYKRLRMSLVYDNNRLNEPSEFFSLQQFVGATDSTFTLSTELHQERKYQLRMGMEWSEYRQGIDGFFGLDFFAGYKQEKYDLEHRTYYHATTTNNGDSLQRVYEDITKRNRPIAYMHEFFEIGLAPIIGWRFFIRKHFELALNASPEVGVAFPMRTTWRGTAPSNINNRAQTEIEFRLRLLEIVLSYRL